jgi:hypothetical protein
MVDRVMANLERLPRDIDRYMLLSSLQERNERLFHRTVIDHVDRILPLIYTPTVGEACRELSHVAREPKGFFITPDDREPRELAAIGRATDWLNSPRLTAASLLGKVVLVDFCTYTCIWLRTLPYIRRENRVALSRARPSSRDEPAPRGKLRPVPRVDRRAASRSRSRAGRGRRRQRYVG